MKKTSTKSISFLLVANLLLSSCSVDIDRLFDFSNETQYSDQKLEFQEKKFFKVFFLDMETLQKSFHYIKK